MMMISYVCGDDMNLGNLTSLWGWNQTTTTLLGAHFPSSHDGNDVSNSCGAGFSSDTRLYAFACPHMMMFSQDMLLAAKYDNLTENFFYATAGSSTDDDCGKCFHVSVDDEEDKHNRPKTRLIVQVINSGGDVGFRQFDLFVGAGGLGYYTACNSDCSSKYCNGGPCHTSLYTGGFSEWTNAQYQTTTNACYNGGVKWFPPMEKEVLHELCANLFKNDDPSLFKNQQVYQSCVLSNRYFYHQNFQAYRLTRVQCPEGLYKLTGLRRSDESMLPIPSLDNVLDETCQGKTCITTMCDCCKPSCAWRYKGKPTDEWPSVRSCDKYGFPF